MDMISLRFMKGHAKNKQESIDLLFQALSDPIPQAQALSFSKQNNSPPADVCRLPADVGRCKAAFPRYYFDGLSGTCKEFAYGGCGGNANNFQTKWKCENRCVDNYIEDYDIYWPSYGPQYFSF